MPRYYEKIPFKHKSTEVLHQPLPEAIKDAAI